MLRAIKSLYHLLMAIAANVYYGFPARKLTVIGVTGTDGKTTTTTLIYEILKKAKVNVSMVTSVHAVIAGKSYDTGFHVTTPDVWHVQKYLKEALDHGDTHFVLEMTSHGLAQYRVFGVPVAIAVLTNITHEHLDWHKTFDEYVKTKFMLLKQAKKVVINRDEDDIYNRALPLLLDKTMITYGLYRSAKVMPDTVTCTLPTIEFNKYNALAAIAVGQELGIDEKVINDAIEQFPGIKGRMEVVIDSPFTVIVDFAHTPNAIAKALSAAQLMTKKHIIHVFGSAGHRDHSKRPLMGAASEKYATQTILTEEDYRTENIDHINNEIQSGMSDTANVTRINDRKEAITAALKEANKGDVVIITGKGHEQSLCRGTTEYPWDDKTAVLSLMKELKLNKKK